MSSVQIAVLAAPALVAGCGAGASLAMDAGDAGAAPGARAGGSAPSASGRGGPGGTIHLVARGALALDPALTRPAAPEVVEPPADALELTSAMLAADVGTAGSARIDGTLVTGWGEPTREIAAGGDLFVLGTLRATDLGAAGLGQAGGAVTIIAQHVVISGTLLTAGGAGPTGGAAGDIAVTVTADLSLSGRVVATGGPGRGLAPGGGQGGTVTLLAGGDILAGGLVWCHGGLASGTAGDATGGAGGAVVIDGEGAVILSGTVDGRGGIADTAGGTAAAGAAGSVRVGEQAAPARIDVLVPVTLAGGEGVAAGGDRGTAHLEPHAGDLRLAGLLDAGGGDAERAPGAGGTIQGNPGPDGATAGVEISGQVLANGGSVLRGTSGDGGGGGLVKLVVLSTAGDISVGVGGKVQVDGGSSGGARRAGAGGLMYLFTRDGAAAMGGPGTVGGSARNDGDRDSVASWPETQDDEYNVQHTAVLINSDGRHGVATGWIDNRGHIVARGGSPDGSGGDVQYHGRSEDGNETPRSGDVDMSGAGTGQPGDFAGG